MKILVTGGAGYIGSHVVKHLSDTHQHEIIILDNLSTGFSETIGKLIVYDPKISFINLDLSEWDKISRFIEQQHFDVVFHFAASLIVPESVTNPHQYYLNNTANTAHLLKQCVLHSINQFIFSSTAATYGEPQEGIVSELSPTMPINPYGYSKLFSEQILKDTAKAYPEFKYIILRYFNVAGANIDGLLGQSTLNATHLIKLAAQTALGLRDHLTIFGEDYPTHDGTCIRDYIHVDDLAQAHLFALKYLQENASTIFNVGYGSGFSVKEVITTMQEITQIPFKVISGARREGDPASLIADNTKILKEFSRYYHSSDTALFHHNNLKLICESAFHWEKQLCGK